MSSWWASAGPIVAEMASLKACCRGKSFAETLVLKGLKESFKFEKQT
jgi:hypothetical protein